MSAETLSRTNSELDELYECLLPHFGEEDFEIHSPWNERRPDGDPILHDPDVVFLSDTIPLRTQSPFCLLDQAESWLRYQAERMLGAAEEIAQKQGRNSVVRLSIVKASERMVSLNGIDEVDLLVLDSNSDEDALAKARRAVAVIQRSGQKQKEPSEPSTA